MNDAATVAYTGRMNREFGLVKVAPLVRLAVMYTMAVRSVRCSEGPKTFEHLTYDVRMLPRVDVTQAQVWCAMRELRNELGHVTWNGVHNMPPNWVQPAHPRLTALGMEACGVRTLRLPRRGFEFVDGQEPSWAAWAASLSSPPVDVAAQ